MQGCGGSHDLAPNSPVTSVIGLESPLFAVLACLGFSRKNQRSAFSDFCNTIGHEPTSVRILVFQRELLEMTGRVLIQARASRNLQIEVAFQDVGDLLIASSHAHNLE